ncbi:hypothetical protein AYR62_02085 [Secundilactobacillus paracollinoides]|uniref:Uncharacterized protein n=1 Tax=Secundilactobacillus paracollinoides TaxID=240427 RepID=A0A1B2IUV2_9LACO|nr:hypothetical protein AYR61_00840 [Secundilactobacillus paracollinoides]ANZ63012.1 hypothetical protein AYR62_02085 [Secundilactobacillus paracollinoides]ANZ65827.1 hypothetical protein AYR63_00855 [Secundilactobacillus paracollinoides]
MAAPCLAEHVTLRGQDPRRISLNENDPGTIVKHQKKGTATKGGAFLDKKISNSTTKNVRINHFLAN